MPHELIPRTHLCRPQQVDLSSTQLFTSQGNPHRQFMCCCKTGPQCQLTVQTSGLLFVMHTPKPQCCSQSRAHVQAKC